MSAGSLLPFVNRSENLSVLGVAPAGSHERTAGCGLWPVIAKSRLWLGIAGSSNGPPAPPSPAYWEPPTVAEMSPHRQWECAALAAPGVGGNSGPLAHM